MTNAMWRFVETARTLAERRGLTWDPPHNSIGKIDKDARWNLNVLAGLPPRHTIYMRDFGWKADDLSILHHLQISRDIRPVVRPSMHPAWCDLYKAAIINAVLINRYTPDAADGTARAVKLLAMCSGEINPDQVTGTEVQLAYNVAIRIGGGSVAKGYVGMIRSLFDALHLAVRPNLYAQCKAYPDAASQAADGTFAGFKERKGKAGKYGAAARQVLGELHDRKDAMKLPDTRAFWEFCRIVFTETPRSVLDLELFAIGRIHVITGLRAGEVTSAPLDWERWHEWTDLEGQPADKRGGIARSLSIRHFALKQARDQSTEGIVLTPRMQPVPEMFEDIVLETLHEVERVTRPMRGTLQRQQETGRFLHDLDPGTLIPVWEAYVRLVGDVRLSSTPIPEEMVRRYVEGATDEKRSMPRFDPTTLDEMLKHQLAALASPIVASSRDRIRWFAMNMHDNVLSFVRYATLKGLLNPRDEAGMPLGPVLEHKEWNKVRFLVSDIEEALQQQGDIRRLEDKTPFNSSDGSLVRAQDRLFLKAKWTRNVPFIHLVSYFSIGRFTDSDLQKMIGDQKLVRHKGLFARYSATEEDRELTLNTHAMRHLQNTELFRMGVSDAIITKRFNRTSVTQSHVYDHRSLQEHLVSIALPEEVEERLGPRAAGTYKLILSERVSGPLVEEFRRVQRERGDDAAFAYLAVEADGLHATPYGFCVNAFTVDPCPNNIECYNGCRHLARTDLPDEQRRLEQLRDRMAIAVIKVEAEPADRVGRANQLRHARVRLTNIEKALGTAPGARPFPDGQDLYRSFNEMSGVSVLDGAGVLPDPGSVDDSPAPRRPTLDMDDA